MPFYLRGFFARNFSREGFPLGNSFLEPHNLLIYSDQKRSVLSLTILAGKNYKNRSLQELVKIESWLLLIIVSRNQLKFRKILCFLIQLRV